MAKMTILSAAFSILVGYDAASDTYSDTSLDLDVVREAVKWGRDDEADAAQMREQIAARLEKLDGPRLRRLQTLIDDADADEGEEA